MITQTKGDYVGIQKQRRQLRHIYEKRNSLMTHNNPLILNALLLQGNFLSDLIQYKVKYHLPKMCFYSAYINGYSNLCL